MQNTLRWIFCLPAAVLASWLAWLLISVLNRITMGMQGIDPDSLTSRAFIEFISHAVMGAVFVYVGAKVAPAHRQYVAYVFSGLSFVTAGFLLYPALIVGSLWAIWGLMSLLIGVSVVLYNIGTGEIQIDP
ncbi:hypothetical protein [Endozoicomonas sp. SESOKO1]|uniref:hypothetical protein n=1 Tax=Endozoicomonas sp. SESOKO1 TaxID=2828742 RepID=UPI002147E52D|nr:hypothetical protein [Endozoicomonas sp. SESOKO1]